MKNFEMHGKIAQKPYLKSKKEKQRDSKKKLRKLTI